jgi:hypothetical protein
MLTRRISKGQLFALLTACCVLGGMSFPTEAAEPACATAPSGLVSWWKGEGNTLDSAGTNNGVAVGSLAYANAEVGSGFSYAAISTNSGGPPPLPPVNYVRVPASPTLDVGAADGFTLEAWVRPSADSTPVAVFAWGSGTTGLGVQFWLNVGGAGSIFANVKDTSGVDHSVTTASGVVVANEFQHIALTFDKTSGTATIFRNGVELNNGTFGQITPRTSSVLYLGKLNSPSGSTYSGLLDEVSIYNRPLSAQELLAIVSAGSAGKCPLPAAPSITQQPASKSATEGQTVSFNVQATGTQPLGYQWKFGGNDLAGETANSLNLVNVQANQAGSYSVVVSNYLGTATSVDAVLKVRAAGTTNACAPSGLVSWWKGEGDATDSGGANDGTISGTLGYAAGEVDQGFMFAGNSGYVKITGNPSLDVGAGGAMTLEGWINPSELNDHYPVWEWNDGTTHPGSPVGEGVNVWLSIVSSAGTGPGSIFISLMDTSGILHQMSCPSGTFVTGTFQHLAVTYDRTTGIARILRNGQVVAEQNLGSFTPQTSYDLYLGYRPTSENLHYKGVMDEVAVYSRALDPEELADIYSSGAAGKCATATAPTITQQPVSVTVSQGGTAAFSVTASGSHPLSYQWRHSGDIDGATSTTLTFSNAQPSQSGSYSVVVSNPYGSVTSSVATLTVNALICAPATSNLVSWWKAEGNTSDTVDGNNGAVVGTMGYVNGEVGQGFSFIANNGYVKVPASSSLDIGAGGALTIEGWIKPSEVNNHYPIWEWNNGHTQPGSPVGEGLNVWLSIVSAAGTGPGSIFVSLMDTTGSLHQMSTPAGTFNTTDFQHLAVTYDRTTGLAKVFRNGQLVTQQQVGAFTPQTTYDFYLGYRPTSENLHFRGIMDEVAVYNRALGSSELAAIYSSGPAGRCEPPALPPSIVQQPVSVRVFEGSSATFTVGVTGRGPFSYQWRFEGDAIAGANQSSLVLSNVLFSQAGAYDVVVSNAVGAVTSSTANLLVDKVRFLVLGAAPAQKEGTTVTLPVSLISTGEVGGFTFVATYDTNYLKNPNLNWDSSLDGTFSDVNTTKAGEVRGTLLLPATSIAEGTQTVAQLTFFLRSVPSTLSTPLGLQVLDMSDPNGDVLSGSRSVGSHIDIQVRTILGDNNANNRLDVGDATSILRYLSGLEEKRSWDVTLNDLNASGTLETGDAIKVLRAASGLDPQPGGGGGAGFAEAKSIKSGPVNVILSPARIQTAPGQNVTVQVLLQNMTTPVAGASFTVNYNTNVLRLLGTSSYHSGSMVPGGSLAVWNISPSGNFVAQTGHATFAVSTANAWTTDNGLLAELTFQVQSGGVSQYLWPITVTSVETTEDGYVNHQLTGTPAILSARAPVAARLTPSGALVDGKFSLTVNGDTGASYLVEASTDLKHWAPISTVVPANGSVVVTDNDSSGLPSRFYRVTAQ